MIFRLAEPVRHDGAMLRKPGSHGLDKQNRRGNNFRLFAVGAVLVIQLSQAGCTTIDAGETVRYEVDRRVAAPHITGELLGGGSYDPATRKGKVVVINFWASYCAPCRVESDDLEAIHTEFPEIEFIGVNVRDDRDKAIAFAKGRSSYLSIFDPAGRVALMFTQVRPNTIPATVIVDQEGRIAAVIQRAIFQDELRAMILEIESGA